MLSYIYDVKIGSKKAGMFPLHSTLTWEDTITEWCYATHCMEEQQKNQKHYSLNTEKNKTIQKFQKILQKERHSICNIG